MPRLPWPNAMLLIVPILLWNVAFYSRLPPAFADDTTTPAAVLWLETVLRIPVFVGPLLLPIRWGDAVERAGLAVYASGSLAYYGSWLPFLLSPDALPEHWALVLAPYVTPLIAFVGIGLSAGSRAYVVASIAMIAAHTVHGGYSWRLW